MAARDEFDDWTPAEIPKASTPKSRAKAATKAVTARNASADARRPANAENLPSVDLTSRSQFRQVTQNYVNAHEAATPAERTAGREWYPKVHEAVSKGIRGTSLSHKQGSGLVAAISPNMDWERTNIPAFGELHGLKEEDWAHIERSAAQPRIRVPGGKPIAAPRSAEANQVLHRLSLASIPDSNLVKAHQIIQGHDPETVLSRRTAPKTNSFMWDIHDPSGASHPSNHPSGNGAPFVTIDGRQHDIGINSRYPWTFSGRGIQSAALPSASKMLKSGKPAKSFGQKTRYEGFEDATKAAAGAVGENPIDMQAITWTAGKRMDRERPSDGQLMKKGQARVGQPYFAGSPQPTKPKGLR